MGGREEEERREGNPLRNFFKKENFQNPHHPHPPFSFNRNRLDPSIPLSWRGRGGGGEEVAEGEGWAVIQIRSWNFPQASRAWGGGRGCLSGTPRRDRGLHACPAVPLCNCWLVGRTYVCL